jgi:acetolactate synthase I/II/III large subunit
VKASDLFVRALEAEGVEYIFTVPGEENLDVLESLRESSIRLVVTRHEQGAGFMAATYGRLTGNPGVALSTLGPGATNLVTAAAHAQLGAMPMVMLTGQKPIRMSKQGAFQIIDVVDMMAPITKYTRQVVSARYLPARVREAFRIAREERPGATHLEIPEGILREETDAEPQQASDVRRPVADERSIESAIALLHGARRPLLVLGSGAKPTYRIPGKHLTAKRQNVLLP